MNFSSRICVVGDLHFKSNNLVEANMLADSIIASVPSEADLVVFLGDILDNHANVHSQAYNIAYRMVHELAIRKGHHVALLVGNHDYINNSQFCTAEHPFNSFKHWIGKRVSIVDTPCNWGNKNESFVFVPYVPVGRFQEAVRSVPGWKEAKCIFGHQEFAGVLFKDQGDAWPLDFPPVISGHIHDRRQLQANVLYLGTPVQHSFGENTDKAISFFGPEGERRIPLGLPTKETVEATIDDLENLSFNPNANTRLILRTNPAEWTSFRKSKQFKELSNSKVKIVPIPIEQNTHQLKQMAKKRRTYMDALEERVATGSPYMKQAFDEVMKGMNHQ